MTDMIKQLSDRDAVFGEMFRTMRDLDSQSFIEIPKPELKPSNYRIWLLNAVEDNWMQSNGNRMHMSNNNWNSEEGGTMGNFGGIYIPHCKIYHQDGTTQTYQPGDLRGKRGILIRDHYDMGEAGKESVVKVQIIAKNLSDFLTLRQIEHTRYNFRRDNFEPFIVNPESPK